MIWEKKEKTIIILLIVMLALNLFTWSNSRFLKNSIQQLQGELSGLRSQISHEVMGLRGTVEGIRDEARWWTPGGVEFLETERENALVKISWHLREFREGSKVLLNYQPIGGEIYEEVLAEEEASGYFSVVLPLKLPLEPFIGIHLQRTMEQTSGKNNRSGNVAVEEKQEYSANSSMNFKYYISVQDGETVRTGEVRSMDLSKLTYNRFNHLNLQIIIDGESIRGVLFEDQFRSDNPYYEIENIYLESRKGKDLTLEQWALKQIDTEPAFGSRKYEAKASPSKDYDSLFLVIHYSDGLTIEREIPQR
jgi:hypothetical protein